MVECRKQSLADNALIDHVYLHVRLAAPEQLIDLNDLTDDLEYRTAGFHMVRRGSHNQGQGPGANPGRPSGEWTVYKSDPFRFALPGDPFLVCPVDRSHANYQGVFTGTLQNAVRSGDQHDATLGNLDRGIVERSDPTHLDLADLHRSPSFANWRTAARTASRSMPGSSGILPM